MIGGWNLECSKGIIREDRERLGPQRKNDLFLFLFISEFFWSDVVFVF